MSGGDIGRKRVTSGSPYEAAFGFSRAVRDGNRIIVAGTGPVEPDGSTTPGGAAEQAARACAIIVAAIEALGGSAADVVRTRMLLTDPADQDAVGAVHAQYFGSTSPAATMAGGGVAVPSRMEDRNRGGSHRARLMRRALAYLAAAVEASKGDSCRLGQQSRVSPQPAD